MINMLLLFLYWSKGKEIEANQRDVVGGNNQLFECVSQ